MIPGVEYLSSAAPAKGLKPSPTRYRALIEHYAQRRLIPVEQALSRDRNTRAAAVRWLAWRELHRQGFSLSGIGITCGKHHTTIIHGLRRLEAIERGERWCARAKKAAGLS